MLRRSALAIALGLTICLAPPSFGGQKDVEESLACQCGCGLTVGNCNHLNCGFAVPVREDIGESLARGETKEIILNRYVDEYGEKVLSAPTTEGFNLVAWVFPYVVLLVAGGIITVVIRRWSHRVDDDIDIPSESESKSERSVADRGRLNRELEDIDT